eukprot:TRINITY_DN459_c0_g1_i1.p1 TRINITY_DN459_c0_g1~~TRINITY_DN459_c0_g1_i1.p1  ORF type:complete len:234 (+),score=69.98 TRINITY_DN459_c0_g1_i1:60-704(+)
MLPLRFSILFVLCAVFAISVHSQKNFNWAAVSYSAYGTNYVPSNPVFPPQASSFFVDVQNERMRIFLGELAGDYYMFKNVSYVYFPFMIPPGFKTHCVKLNYWSFDAQVKGYSNLTSIGVVEVNGQQQESFFGFAFDVFSEGYQIGVMMLTDVKTQTVAKYSYVQNWPNGCLGTNVVGFIQVNQTVIGSPSSNVFDLPKACLGADVEVVETKKK